MAPRDNLRSERVRPSIGARMPVTDYNDEFEMFAVGLDNSIRDILELEQVYEQDQPDISVPEVPGEVQAVMTEVSNEDKKVVARPRAPYKIYEADDLRMTLAERRWSGKRPNRRAEYWSPSDIARMIQEIGGEIGELPLGEYMDEDGSLKIAFDSVKRVGGHKKGERRGRKLALIPEDNSGYELLCRMNERVVGVFNRHHKNYQYPDEYIPHVTFGRLDHSIPEKQVGKIVAVASKLLPVEVKLGPIEFYDTQQISIRKY